jgi:hypothetical protein
MQRAGDEIDGAGTGLDARGERELVNGHVRVLAIQKKSKTRIK